MENIKNSRNKQHEIRKENKLWGGKKKEIEDFSFTDQHEM